MRPRAVADATTLWDCRQALITAAALGALFLRLDRAISEAGSLPMGGQIVDATLLAAPRQRNTGAEKTQIKKRNKAADIWPDKPAKRIQDAHWTVQFSKPQDRATKATPREDGAKQADIALPSFGDKSPISIDSRHRIVRFMCLGAS